jgi:sigma-54 dependent transcriptional regulator, acetoin dehydrogenase operon transcriptional activator AcoR
MYNELATQEELEENLKAFVQGREIPGERLRPAILQSWLRCKKKNIDYRQQKYSLIFYGQSFEQHKAKYSEFLAVCMPIMREIYSFLRGDGFVVAVFDESGIMLEIIGDPEVKKVTDTVNFIEGGSWAEDVAGTNAVGTSIVLNQPLQVFGREHYCLRSAHWTCSAAPIHDTDGKIIGILDITGPYEKVHSHTLGMVVTAASDIETQLRLKKILHSLELSDNYKNTIIDSISEGLLAVDDHGMVVHINDTAASSIGYKKENVIGRKLQKFLSLKKNPELFDILRNKACVTDYELNLITKKKHINCLFTSRLINVEEKSIGTVSLFSEIQRAKKMVLRMSGREARYCFSDLIGRDVKFLETVEIAKKSSGSQSNILILGESGTGKDVLAQAIHNASLKRNGPFVAINCSSIPRELIASELFGYVDGAFTGASRTGRPGKFELADRGTLFLDEIGEMPIELQTSLLRVLETKTIMRLGDNTVTSIDVRIIAATNKDLHAEVLNRSFRRDLFYRLNVITIHMIPLRERKGDIPLFIDHFLAHLSKTLSKKQVRRIDNKILNIFNNYDWPGNVRELQNVLERALNVCTEPVLSFECLPQELRNINATNIDKPMDYYERELLEKLFKKNNRNISKVAAEIGISRTTLYRKMTKYNMTQREYPRY